MAHSSDSIAHADDFDRLAFSNKERRRPTIGYYTVVVQRLEFIKDNYLEGAAEQQTTDTPAEQATVSGEVISLLEEAMGVVDRAKEALTASLAASYAFERDGAEMYKVKQLPVPQSFKGNVGELIIEREAKYAQSRTTKTAANDELERHRSIIRHMVYHDPKYIPIAKELVAAFHNLLTESYEVCIDNTSIDKYDEFDYEKYSDMSPSPVSSHDRQYDPADPKSESDTLRNASSVYDRAHKATQKIMLPFITIAPLRGLNTFGPRRLFNTHTKVYQEVTGILIQMFGTDEQGKCSESCGVTKDNNGPFLGCYALPVVPGQEPTVSNACANCMYRKKASSCKHALPQENADNTN